MNSTPKERLSALNWNNKLISSTLKTESLTNAFMGLLDRTEITNADKNQGKSIYHLVTNSIEWIQLHQLDKCAKSIMSNELTSRKRVGFAIDYFKINNDSDTVKDVERFNTHCGVGIEYTAEQIDQYIEEFIEKSKQAIMEKGAMGLLVELKEGLKFADEGTLIKIYNKTIGKKKLPRKAPAKAKSKVVKQKDTTQENDNSEEDNTFSLKKMVAKSLQSQLNKPHIREAHEKRTGGKIITRFPPEPNGYLHIGHCKAIRFNFRVALENGGYTYLRYDDTNPAKEKQEYIDCIESGVRWLGYKPYKITYASEYFPQIYEVAVKLIEVGKAFVCFLSMEDGKEYREAKRPSPWRDASVEENLKQFGLMKAGFYDEGVCVLRAKIDYLSNHTTLNDPPIYRIKHVPHPHVKDKWCIYPLYDFTHSLCDNFEDITHSLCTLEFDTRRELYYWSLDVLDMFKPFVWEYSRLNITHTILSKRKITRLVEEKCVIGWDDPRLLTLEGIKRRGYPAEAVNHFCDQVGVTRRGNDMCLSFDFFEFVMRDWLRKLCPKSFIVQKPVKVTLTNFEEWAKSNQATLKNKNIEHELQLSSQIWVDSSDVSATKDKKFWGIQPDQRVRLRYGPFIEISKIESGEQGVTSVEAKILTSEEVGNYKKIKGILHWISEVDAFPVTVNVFGRLFTADFPGKDRDLIEDVDLDSWEVLKGSLISKKLAEKLGPDSRYQFERMGFFALDYETDFENKKFVFNRIVDMKNTYKPK